MASASSGSSSVHKIVEVIGPLEVNGRHIAPGARLLAWKSASGWTLTFNGADVPVPPGTVGEVDSAEVKEAIAKRASARDEEYALAPSKPKGN